MLFNSTELKFMALMFDSDPALEHILITLTCTYVLGARSVPTLRV